MVNGLLLPCAARACTRPLHCELAKQSHAFSAFAAWNKGRRYASYHVS